MAGSTFSTRGDVRSDPDAMTSDFKRSRSPACAACAAALLESLSGNLGISVLRKGSSPAYVDRHVTRPRRRPPVNDAGMRRALPTETLVCTVRADLDGSHL